MKIIGIIKSIEGEYFIQKPDGTQIKATKDAQLTENDIIIGTDKSVNVVVTLDDGGDILIQGNQKQLFDSSLTNTPFDVEDTVISPDSLSELLAKEIDEEDINDIETEAGDEANSSESSYSATFLERENRLVDIDASLRTTDFNPDIKEEIQDEDVTIYGTDLFGRAYSINDNGDLNVDPYSTETESQIVEETQTETIYDPSTITDGTEQEIQKDEPIPSNEETQNNNGTEESTTEDESLQQNDKQEDEQEDFTGLIPKEESTTEDESLQQNDKQEDFTGLIPKEEIVIDFDNIPKEEDNTNNEDTDLSLDDVLSDTPEDELDDGLDDILPPVEETDDKNNEDDKSNNGKNDDKDDKDEKSNNGKPDSHSVHEDTVVHGNDGDHHGNNLKLEVTEIIYYDM